MFRPVTLFIAFRYLCAQNQHRFISFVAWISFLGIVLGVAVLITVLAVMEGFIHDVKKLYLHNTPHVQMLPWQHHYMQPNAHVMQQLASDKAVDASMAFVQGQALLAFSGHTMPLGFYAIDVKKMPKQLFTDADDHLLAKRLQQHAFGLLLGSALADKLGISLGSKVTLLMPKMQVSLLGVMPRYKRFTVTGILLGNQSRYASFAVMNLDDAQKLLQLEHRISGIRLWLKQPYRAAQFVAGLQDIWPQYQMDTWMDQHMLYFRTVRTEKSMMVLILSLIILIASFNLITSLVMLVNEKRSDIAIMKTLGMTSMAIMRIFMLQGSMIGLFAVSLGSVLGIFLARHVSAVVLFIEHTFHVALVPAAIYGLDYLPSYVVWSDVFLVVWVALGLAFLATIYPSWRASSVQPVSVLRYE